MSILTSSNRDLLIGAPKGAAHVVTYTAEVNASGTDFLDTTDPCRIDQLDLVTSYERAVILIKILDQAGAEQDFYQLTSNSASPLDTPDVSIDGMQPRALWRMLDDAGVGRTVGPFTLVAYNTANSFYAVSLATPIECPNGVRLRLSSASVDAHCAARVTFFHAADE